MGPVVGMIKTLSYEATMDNREGGGVTNKSVIKSHDFEFSKTEQSVLNQRSGVSACVVV